MRKTYSTQIRPDSQPIDQVQLNLVCRDTIISVLRSLQHRYSKPNVTEKISQIIGRDINGKTGVPSCESHDHRRR